MWCDELVFDWICDVDESICDLLNHLLCDVDESICDLFIVCDSMCDVWEESERSSSF